MVIDTSAVLAILFAESDASTYSLAIDRAESCSMSAANFLEAAIVVDGRGDAVASRELDKFMRRSGVNVVPVTFEMAQIARAAYRDFGKGRHRAGLDFGDCLSYALAKAMDEPLLYKGSDFAKTDIEGVTAA